MFKFIAVTAFAGLTFAGSLVRAADTYQVDPVHSTLLFRVKHLGAGWAYGRVNEPTGSVTIDAQDPSKSSFNIEADAAKIDTANQKRDDHLRGPDFFSAKQFPKLTFKSNSVSQTGENTYNVSGDLTMRGVTKPVTTTLEHVGTVKDPWGNTRTGFEGTFTVKRSDFGINFMPDGLADEVKIIVSFEAMRK